MLSARSAECGWQALSAFFGCRRSGGLNDQRVEITNRDGRSRQCALKVAREPFQIVSHREATLCIAERWQMSTQLMATTFLRAGLHRCSHRRTWGTMGNEMAQDHHTGNSGPVGTASCRSNRQSLVSHASAT